MPVDYLERFPLIAQRIGPDSSRPPSIFRLDYQNRYFRVWKRVAPGKRIAAHLPFQDAFEGALPAPCDALEAMQRDAEPGVTFLASKLPETVEVDVVGGASHPPLWPPDNEIPRSLQPHTPGNISSTRPFKAGNYEVWIAGSTGRALHVQIDGREVGQASGVNTNGEWLRVGSVHVSGGPHRIDVVRPGGDLTPGDGYEGEIGPVVFEALPDSSRLVRARSAPSLCGQRLDWVEAVRPGVR
jgi:hypothetical protein